MLHFESRQGSKENTGTLTLSAVLVFLFLLTGCRESATYTKRNLTLECFEELVVNDYALDSLLIYESLGQFCKRDLDTRFAVARVQQYYKEGGRFLWVDYQGVDNRADTLLAFLQRRLPEIGFSESEFELSLIHNDIGVMRTLGFVGSETASRTAARLEYRLMKAYMRYVTGQRFGFVNPTYVLNRYEAQSVDTAGRALSYRPLYDVAIEHPTDEFFRFALRKITTDSLTVFLREVEPQTPLYARLAEMLPTANGDLRHKVLVNMDRQRWREKQQPKADERYVIVNVPSFHLWAVSPDTIVDMRVACGAVKTKTPLLSSRITHMEVNPQWVIPMSIIRDDVSRHGGDSAYFARHGYYISERKTGKRVSAKQVSAAMLQSGLYRVAQYGGAGNSLGRLIFRFPNNFSVFLHDTSSPGAFRRDNRGVSHGCVRVQRPFDLAVFMMGNDTDEWTIDKLRISMGMEPETNQGRELIDGLEPPKPYPTLLHSLTVSPRVPIFITYYTIFLTPDGSLQYYPDVYGYDDVIGEALKQYIE